jgi:hypothetical protein
MIPIILGSVIPELLMMLGCQKPMVLVPMTSKNRIPHINHT